MDAGNKPINYAIIAEALSFYTARGFGYIEMPWTVSQEAIRATLPEGNRPFSVGPDKFLVGSAEQSFVEYMQQGKKLGKHCAITPCFRDDAVDSWHQKYFMKLELYEAIADPASANKIMQGMIDAALSFYGRYLPVTTEKTAEGWDIVSVAGGIELGSYGVRFIPQGSWVYGTGVAEPRLSSAVRYAAEATRAA